MFARDSAPPPTWLDAMQSAQFQLHAEIEERHWWFVARRQILTAVIEAVVPPSPETTIVDVGCGTGANLAGLADRYECVGIDASYEADSAGPASAFRGCDSFTAWRRAIWAESSSGPGWCSLTDVLEHVADDFALFSELLAAAPAGHVLSDHRAGRPGAVERARSGLRPLPALRRRAIRADLAAACRSSQIFVSLLQLAALSDRQGGPRLEPLAWPRGGPAGTDFSTAHAR